MSTTQKKEEQLAKITGFLGSEPNFSKSDKGIRKVSLSIGQNIKGQDKPSWKNVVLWNELADVTKDLKKGSKITIEGKEQSTPYTDKKGVEQAFEFINAKEINLHQKLDAELNIGHIQLASKDNAPHTITVYENNPGSNVTEKHSLILFTDDKQIVDKLEVGDQIHVIGDLKGVAVSSDGKPIGNYNKELSAIKLTKGSEVLIDKTQSRSVNQGKENEQDKNTTKQKPASKAKGQDMSV